MMPNNLLKKIHSKAYIIISLCVILLSLTLFPLHRVTTNRLQNNPHDCNYYITLQSILANYPLLNHDKANIRYIKSLLIKFENDVSALLQKYKRNKIQTNYGVAMTYNNEYQGLFQGQHFKKSSALINENDILSIAKESSPIIDNFYLDNQLFCLNPLYYWSYTYNRRILLYNLGGLYSDLPNKYSRILVAFPNDSQLGIFSGFFVNNQTTTLETQFMTGMPMLTALYVLPKNDFSKVGGYFAMVPWVYFRAHSFQDPLTRQLLNISGIDVFSVLDSDMKDNKIKTIPNTIPLKTNVYTRFGGGINSYINTQSYGTAYLANQITYVNPTLIKLYEDKIKEYFSITGKRDPKVFQDAVGYLYKKLLELKGYRSILLEKPASSFSVNTSIPSGDVKITGIVGPRAAFDVDCLRQSCTFVYNLSFAPGWHAFVNKKQVVISRANFAFMGVSVPYGHSTVWFIYEPMTTLISYLISIVTLLGIILAMSLGYNDDTIRTDK